MPLHIVFALLAACFYSVSSLFNKQALAHGCDPLRIYSTQAWIGTLLLSPFLFSGPAMPVTTWWQPALMVVIWFCGSFLFVYTLRDGDLSIIGPVAGIKPAFNALLITLLLGQRLSILTWIACGLAAISLFVIRTPSSKGSHSFRRTAAQTLVTMFLFASTDLCLQRWGPDWGALRFAALLFLGGAILSLFMIPTYKTKYRDLSRPTRRHFLKGAFLSTLPGILIAFSIGTYGHGTEINISFSTHVLITLVLVWFYGNKFGNQEHTAGHKIFLRRLAGAAILLIAVAMIISGK